MMVQEDPETYPSNALESVAVGSLFGSDELKALLPSLAEGFCRLSLGLCRISIVAPARTLRTRWSLAQTGPCLLPGFGTSNRGGEVHLWGVIETE